MSELYFALTRRCNQNCASCPRHQEEKISDASYENVKGRLFGTLRKFDVTKLILSGGEPTLYPEFPELLRQLDGEKMAVFIQSNGQRFQEASFVDACFGSVDCKNFCVMTAFHYPGSEIHDLITGVPGSFARAVEGVHRLLQMGVRVVVKCILSKLNIAVLPDYLRWLGEEFGGAVELCISGMDYIGMNEEERKAYVLDYDDAKAFLEETLGYYERYPESVQSLAVIELPLCMLEQTYGVYFKNTRHARQLYQDAYMNYPTRRIHDFTTDYDGCQICGVKRQCPGIWREQYKSFGEKCVKPIIGRNKDAN